MASPVPPRPSRLPALSGVPHLARIVAAVIVVAVVAGAAGIWYVAFRPAGPAAVIDESALPTLVAAASQAPSPTPTEAPTATPAPTASPTEAPTEAPPAPTAAPTPVPTPTPVPASGALDGTWTVNPAIGSFSDYSGSFVGYRVQEQLANIGAATAVGRTPDVTGSFSFAGTTVTAASFTARLTNLKSDDNGRDGRVQDALSTRTYPTATFVLTNPVNLGSLPASGQSVKATATGRLTIRGVTRTVGFSITATRNGSSITVKGAAGFAFADFSIPKPSSFMVLSIADTGTIEVQLQLTRS